MENRWGNNGNSDRLYLCGFKITADETAAMKLKDICSLEEAMTSLDRILKSRDITLPTNFCLVKTMIFQVVMCACESWTIKKAECWRIDAFELCCWRLLRVPWTTRSSNQSILKEISPECSLKGLILELQNFGHLMWRTDSLEKTLMLGKIEGRRRRGQQRMRWLDGITNSWTWVWVRSRSWWWTGKLGMLQSVSKRRTLLSNWTELTKWHWYLLRNPLETNIQCCEIYNNLWI